MRELIPVRFNLSIFSAFKICLYVPKIFFKMSLSFSGADIVDVVNLIGYVSHTRK